MATEICPNEGKHWILTNAVSAGTFYGFLLHSATIAAGTITATSSLSSIQASYEITGSTYTRQTVVFGTAQSTGIIQMPAVTFANGNATNWNSDCAAWGIATSSTAGTALYYWDLSATRNMTSSHSTISIPALSFFLLNPGE